MRTLELLAPAKNLESGIAAVDHGADAVYIGAMQFGARAAAGNSIEDIAQLCTYAHRFSVKVYVTINTIIYENELEQTEALIWQLYRVGVDAILVQDMGVLKMKLPNIALHASTQTDNRSVEKVKWLHGLGFERVVLARELSVKEIREIHQAAPDVELEAFVHGALCVSYSGICYVSEHCFGRSANRGECAQFCRMKFDLIDSDGMEIEHQRYLLSMKDLCQIDNLEPLVMAGACSFKIEGRLKDLAYVKNVVSAYSMRLNEIIEKYPNDFCRASVGEVKYDFTPSLNKVFNRGYTSYFADGRRKGIASFDTPKAMGEYVGKVKEIRSASFNVAGTASFANGDGLCFINANRELEGFRVNRVEGNRLFPFKMPAQLKPGVQLYRNNDEVFTKQMAKQTAERKLPVRIELNETENGFVLKLSLVHQGKVTKTYVKAMECDKQLAQKPQRDNIIRQLTKLGNTPYKCEKVELADGVERYFIPSGFLASLRREVVEVANNTENEVNERVNKVNVERKTSVNIAWTPAYKAHPYIYNVSNHLSEDFYRSQGLATIDEAFEVKKPKTDSSLLMQCRHCIKFSLGYCVRHGGEKPTWHEPLYLKLGDGRRFRLHFNCKECQMNVLVENNE